MHIYGYCTYALAGIIATGNTDLRCRLLARSNGTKPAQLPYLDGDRALTMPLSQVTIYHLRAMASPRDGTGTAYSREDLLGLPSPDPR
jgi:hypothetical protein